MADSGPGIAGPMSSGPSSSDADGRIGMLQLNQLVYKLDPDLSVAVSRTHKIQFPQSQDYTNEQTTTFIVNSGADYIDCSRSWLSLDIEIADVKVPIGVPFSNDAKSALESLEPYLDKAFLNFAFGPNGSILNMIESVVVSSRSGDELSRVSNYAQLMNTYIPLTFGKDWRETIGSNIGMGSYVGCENGNEVYLVNEQIRRRFCIPLYLLSPFFNYGRLMPSMVMSGLRIEIRWKPLDQATQQFWTGFPKYLQSFGVQDTNVMLNEDQTEFAQFLASNNLIGQAPYPRLIWPQELPVMQRILQDTEWELKFQGAPGQLQVKELRARNSDLADPPVYTAVNLGVTYTEAQLGPGHPLIGSQIISPGTTLLLPFLNFQPAGIGPDAYLGDMCRFEVLANYGDRLIVATTQPEFTVWQATNGRFGDRGGVNGVAVGAMLLSGPEPTVYQEIPGGWGLSGLVRLPDVPITRYNIKKPQLHLASVQLTDAIQRVLNEFSSVNGLEIVFADYDHTSSPFVTYGDQNPLYMEIRKSASRALMAFARVVQTSSNAHRYDSFSSCPYSHWNSYQWQLGSLYFPQQRVEDSHSVALIRQDNVACVAYNYCLDAWDRLHPKSAPTMLSLRGDDKDVPNRRYHPNGTNGEHSLSTYLNPPSKTGKWGSFVNGATTVATTLERSSAFDLSGIPTNNARVLALRANVGFNVPQELQGVYRASCDAYLKFVRLARVFLLNVEVEQ